MKVKVQNLDLFRAEKTYLDSDYSSGLNLTVRNNVNFTTDWFVVVGEPGQEQTELRRIYSVSGNQGIVLDSALRFFHPKSCPVYLSQFDKWAFERKPSAGSFSAISNSPLDMDWSAQDLFTNVYVSGGLTTDTYRWRPLNSYLGVYGTYSDELPGEGLSANQVGYLLDKVKLNPIAKNIDENVIMSYFSDFEGLVYEEMPQAWWFSKEGTSLTLTTNVYRYPISDNWEDFLSMDMCLFEYINGSVDETYPLTFSPNAEFRALKADANQSTDDYGSHWNLLPPDNDSPLGYIGIHPTPRTSTCKIKPVYYFEPLPLDSFTDVVVVPKPKGYIDYALYRIYDDIKRDTANADKYNKRVSGSLKSLKTRAKRQLGQKQLFRFRGQRGFSRLFGRPGGVYSSSQRELYW